uniref:Uncharacterized protein n=2 Tax=Emiliania huxleyi TaxID=2903 RepID=A0A6V2T2M7_EMIHU
MSILAELPADELASGAAGRGRPEAARLGRRSRRRGGSEPAAGGEVGQGEARAQGRLRVVTLATLRFFPTGRLDVRPPLNELPPVGAAGLDARTDAEAGADTVADVVLDRDADAPWYRIGSSRYEFRLWNLSERPLEGDDPPGTTSLLVSADPRPVLQAGGLPPLAVPDFALPPPPAARVLHLVEIQSLTGFGTGRLCVQYFASASPGWRLLPASAASTGSTQVVVAGAESGEGGSSSGSEGDKVSFAGLAALVLVATTAACAALVAAAADSAAVARKAAISPTSAALLAGCGVALVALALGASRWAFGAAGGGRRCAHAAISMPLEFVLESIGAPSTARPPLSLFLSVLRVEPLGRHTHLGYVHFQPPARAEESMHMAGAFRLAMSRGDLLDDFFVGGMKELHDLRALGIPSGFDAPCLNKYGLRTASSGYVSLRSHTLLQQQPDPSGTSASDKSRPAKALNQGAIARAAAARTASPGGAARRRLPLRAIAGARSLGASESASDRVRKRLQERREAEAAAAASSGNSALVSGETAAT